MAISASVIDPALANAVKSAFNTEFPRLAIHAGVLDGEGVGVGVGVGVGEVGARSWFGLGLGFGFGGLDGAAKSLQGGGGARGRSEVDGLPEVCPAAGLS